MTREISTCDSSSFSIKDNSTSRRWCATYSNRFITLFFGPFLALLPKPFVMLVQKNPILICVRPQFWNSGPGGALNQVAQRTLRTVERWRTGWSVPWMLLETVVSSYHLQTRSQRTFSHPGPGGRGQLSCDGPCLMDCRSYPSLLRILFACISDWLCALSNYLVA